LASPRRHGCGEAKNKRYRVGATGFERVSDDSVESEPSSGKVQAFGSSSTEPTGAKRHDSSPLESGSRPFATAQSKITDAEIATAAARAILEGRGELAEFLMHEVKRRREQPVGTVVPLASKRPW
jgi:hypothetical protein